MNALQHAASALFVSLLVLTAAPARAQDRGSTAAGGTTGVEARAPGSDDLQSAFGAFSAPAVLPPGTASAYAFAGVPEVGGGYRQGLGVLEIDARFKLNYFALAIAFEGALKYSAYEDGPLQIGPWLGLGLVWDSGTRYIDPDNFSYIGLRIIPGTTVSYRIAETASILGELQVPIDISLSPGGGNRYTPLLGGGGEIYIGDDLTAAGLAQFGVDVIKEPQGVPRTRFAFALRVGLGYRFF